MNFIERLEKAQRRKRLRVRLTGGMILLGVLAAFAVGSTADAAPISESFLNDLLSKCELDRPKKTFIADQAEADPAYPVYSVYVNMQIRLGKDKGIVCPGIWMTMPVRYTGNKNKL